LTKINEIVRVVLQLTITVPHVTIIENVLNARADYSLIPLELVSFVWVLVDFNSTDFKKIKL
jgi:hypothetical protein